MKNAPKSSLHRPGMRPAFSLLLTVALLFATFSWAQVPDSNGIHLADPTLFYHQKKFYLYGTVEGKTSTGFLVYVSKDLQKWKLHEDRAGYALQKGEAFGTAGFWAPQVFVHRGKFYMAYTANEQIAIAVADHPAGPFRQEKIQALNASAKQIDPFVFIDADGKIYLYHVRLENGNRIFVAELEDDLLSIKPGTLKECIAAIEGWENTAAAKWPVAEGPAVFKRGDMYYLFYSANDFRNPDYAVGYATSAHPTGPWVKHTTNPVLSKHLTGINGSGHGDFLHYKNRWKYVFHTHNGNNRVGPRRTALINVSFNKNLPGVDPISMERKSFHFLKR